MQGNINLDLQFCLGDKGYSLDELVFKLKELFENKGFNKLLELIVRFTGENIYLKTISGVLNWNCCGSPRYVSNGCYSRKVKSSLGVIELNFSRVKCVHCNKTLVPLKQYLQIKKYQRKTTELEQLVVEAVSKDSYRRAVESINSIGFVSVPHRTAHRWVIESECSEIEVSQDTVTSHGKMHVMADGTKFKGITTDSNQINKKGDLKVMLGINTKGDVFPIGSWTDTSWKLISQELKDKQLKFPFGTVLVSDGEPGLADSLAEHFDYVQRCHWHIIRDLYHSIWQDGGTAKQSRPLQKALAGVLAIDLPKEDFSKVTENTKNEIEEKMEKALLVINKLICLLESKGYHTAANYISKASGNMFNYLRRWLKLGIICPRASSLIERIMRELARRLRTCL